MATSPSGSAAAPPPLVLVIAAGTMTRCRALRGTLGSPDVTIAAEATSPADVEAAVVRFRPGAVLLDTELTAGGLETIERIMATAPTPIVVCGPAAEQPQAALGAGAVSVVGRRDGTPGSAPYVLALRRHLHFASRIRVITHPRGRWRARPVAVTGVAAATATAPVELLVAARVTTSYATPSAVPLREVPPPVAPLAHPGCELVVIGASTGGPPALARILGELSPQFDVPVLVVQHMADGFVEGLAEWLGTVSPLPVSLVRDGTRLKPRTVSIAPAGCNVIVHRGLRVELVAPFPNQFHVPGIDATFTSVAESCGGRAIGVLLTGMGRDGAAGLRKMRESGAMTIGQDESTSVVYGMPAAAVALDAVELQLALPDVAGVLVALVDRPAPPYGGRRP